MPIIPQIILGSGLMILALGVQVGLFFWAVQKLQKRHPIRDQHSVQSNLLMVAILFVPLLFSHTVHIYAWAFMIWLLGALPGYEEPIYFALVTYTTVGYGDVTLTKDFRVFGAMASVNGILSFGLSTAFLVGVFAKIYRTMGGK